MRHDTSRLSSTVIAGLVQEKVRGSPSLKTNQIRADLKNIYGFDIPYMKVWRGVDEAKSNIYGGYNESFDELRWYSEAILAKNPGSVVSLDTDPVTNQFKRFFFSFNASLEGFKFCRPMLFIDGTFLNNRYKGTLLAATAKDGNNGIFILTLISTLYLPAEYESGS